MEGLLQKPVDEVEAAVRDLGYRVIAEELLAGLNLGLCSLPCVIAGAEPDDTLIALEYLDGKEADVIDVLRQGLLDVGESVLDGVAEDPLLCGRSLCSTASRHSSMAFLRPSPLMADTSTTGTPNFAESLGMLMLSPRFLTTSIMLMAMTTGMPSSASWVVR